MKKTILIILQSYPYPLNTGGRQGVFSNIDAIKDDYNVILNCYNDKNWTSIKSLQEIWPTVKFIPYIQDVKHVCSYFLFKKLISKLLKNMFSKSPHQQVDNLFNNRFNYFNPEYYEFINKIVIENSVDIVQCEFMINLTLVHCLPDKVKKVFVHHELEYIRNLQFLDKVKLPKAYKDYIFCLLKKNEIQTLSDYDAVITHSQVDTDKLITEGVTSNIFTSFSMVKVDTCMDSIKSYNFCLSFVGPENHMPNKMGLQWFLDYVWPLLLSENSKWHLKIIGNWSRSTQSAWKSKYTNLSFTGFVYSLKDVLFETIMIVPIQIGSGIRMKLQEAAYMRIPFVSTTIGIEGLPFQNKIDCFICDEKEDFANKIMTLSVNIELQNLMTQNAYNRINSCFSKEKLKQSREIAYNSLYNE